MSAKNGEYIFDICNAEGENQFIPSEDSSYVVTVQVWNGNKLKSEGKSAVAAVKCRSAAIYDKVNAILPLRFMSVSSNTEKRKLPRILGMTVSSLPIPFQKNTERRNILVHGIVAFQNNFEGFAVAKNDWIVGTFLKYSSCFL